MENNKARKGLPAFAVLGIIAVVAALVLALTNAVTKGPIAEYQMAALRTSFAAVMPAEDYAEIEVNEDYGVDSLYEAKSGGETVGWCVTASVTGYGGPVAVTLGVGLDGVVTGCVVGDTNFAETVGFGARAKEPAFQDQFVGLDGQNGGSIEALSGATITSTAVLDAANLALRCVNEIGLSKPASVNPIVTFSNK